MKAKLFRPVLALHLFFAASLFAQVPAAPSAPKERVVDNADVLSAAEKADLESRAASAASSYNFDLVIVTENDTGGVSPMNYADDFFDNNNYGRGNDRDGCLFLVVTGSREYRFSTSGRGIEMMNASAGNKLDKDALRFLGADDYAGAFNVFIDDWEQFLVLDAKGRRYNFFHEWNLVLTGAAWLLALVIGFIIVHSWKARMDTVFTQGQAGAYTVAGSLKFTNSSERFLYSTVSRTRRQTQSSPASGGLHRSSSGRSHGGRGGRY